MTTTPIRLVASAVLALCLAPGPARAASVKYQDVSIPYTRHPRIPLPAPATTFSLQGAEALGLDPAAVTIGGLSRVPMEGAVQLQLSGSAPVKGPPALASFTSRIFLNANNKATLPAYDVTVHWASVAFELPATLTVTIGNPGKPFDVGAKLGLDVCPKPEKTSSGVFQLSTSPWVLMQNEPANTVEALLERVKWIAQQMCADVKSVPGSQPELRATNGRARLQAKLAELSEAEVAAKLRVAVLERVNAILDRDLASGPRTVKASFAVVEDDKRFDAAQKAIAGQGSDRFTAAASALEGVSADATQPPRVRAAAAYDVALCRIGAGELDAAAQEIARSKALNAQEGDGWFGSTGKDLGKKLDALETFVKELQQRAAIAPATAAPAPAPEPMAPMKAVAPAAGKDVTSPAPSAAAPPTAAPSPVTPAAFPPAATAAPAARPWTEMTDDEFRAAYPALVQAAVGRRDTAEMQALGTRMTAIMTGKPAPKR